MTPKSKPTSSSKAKSKDISKNDKLAFSMKKKMKQQSLKGRKSGRDLKNVAASPGANKEIKQNRAISSASKENHAKLKKLEAENDALRKSLAAKEHTTVTIPRPEKGIAGNGFNLQEAMGLADDVETYTLLRRSVRDLAAQAGLDCSVLWYHQPKEVISKIIGAARERHSYFKRFPHGWAVEEFLKSSLKNKRAYARKRGYLEDKTNGGIESDEGEDIDADQGSNGTGGDNGENGASGSLDGDDIDNIDDDQISSKGAPGAGDEKIDDDIYASSD